MSPIVLNNCIGQEYYAEYDGYVNDIELFIGKNVYGTKPVYIEIYSQSVISQNTILARSDVRTGKALTKSQTKSQRV